MAVPKDFYVEAQGDGGAVMAAPRCNTKYDCEECGHAGGKVLDNSHYRSCSRYLGSDKKPTPRVANNA